MAIIPGRACDGAFIQVITQEGSYCVQYPGAEYRGGGSLRLGDSLFSKEGVCLSISGEGLELGGSLRYSELTPIRGDIMGPFRFLPMQCRHTVVSMRHRISGQVTLNGQEIDFSDGRGYLEGDSGRSFPKSYTWVHSNDFQRDCSIMASVAHIPFAGGWFWGCICVVCLEGREYRLATYRGVRILHRSPQRLTIAQGRDLLDIRFPDAAAGHSLNAPIQGRMGRTIHETPCARVQFEFSREGRVLFREESPFASYEQVY